MNTDAVSDKAEMELFRELAALREGVKGLAADLASLRAENERLKENIDCGCGVSGCRNTRQKCDHCALEDLGAERDALLARCEKLEHDISKEIDERDRWADALQRIDITLGGTGEWSNNYCCAGSAEERAVALVDRCKKLEAAERLYRDAHDSLGPSSITTGRLWDRMRRAGDRLRAVLDDAGRGKQP